mgnify:CR=1 FL=1
MKSTVLAALEELRGACAALDDVAMAAAVDEIASAKRIALYGVGREGLQIKGLCMRLHHLGLSVSMVGDMTTPPIGAGDLLVVSAGPGDFSTVEALMEVARDAGARTLVVTAQPGGRAPLAADRVLTIPARTMADDRDGPTGVLPMGSLFEGAEFVVFEALVISVRERLGIDPADMRARHTNLE